MKKFLYKLLLDTKEFDDSDKTQIRKDIEKKYEKVAISPKGNFKYPTGLEALHKQIYPREILDLLPEEILDSYCGTGNPFKGGAVGSRERIFDFGCGAGIDSIVAARLTGSRGKVIGGDIVLPMLEKAKRNAKLSKIPNLDFMLLDNSSLPFEDRSFDTVISNSVVNLVPDKKETLKELYRCLKFGGQLLLVDQVFRGVRMKKHEDRVNSWFQ